MKWVWVYRIVSFISLAALTLVPGRASDVTPSTNSASELFVQRVLELTNLQRKKVGVPPLRLQDKLAECAIWKARDMASKNYFSHDDANGRGLAERVTSFGYGSWTAVGENIAAGQESPEEVVDGWMKSPSHRQNLLSADYAEIGIGYAVALKGEYHTYWVQEFGSRS